LGSGAEINYNVILCSFYLWRPTRFSLLSFATLATTLYMKAQPSWSLSERTECEEQFGGWCSIQQKGKRPLMIRAGLKCRRDFGSNPTINFSELRLDFSSKFCIYPLCSETAPKLSSNEQGSGGHFNRRNYFHFFPTAMDNE
jgi:hypothetical protein